MIRKVTDPNRVVTDPVLLSVLSKAGIDKDYVEFYQDYAPRSLGKRHSPYAKFYRDLKSGQHFAVISQLPMVTSDGIKIEAGWRVAGINYFSEKNNLFRAKVQGTQVEITIRNDQPDGRKAGDKLTFKPQLFLDGVEKTCGQSTLLPVDPVNPNYLENTLEWDYSICKRRLRIIEGRLLGSWVFASKPTGTIRIKYNQTGDYRLRLGQFAIDADTEQITPEQFEEEVKLQGYPVTISDSAIFYPDADPETSSVDGNVLRQSASSWADLRAGAGTDASSSGTHLSAGFFSSDNPSLPWYRIDRAPILFDTSSLPDSAFNLSAVMSLYGSTKLDDNGAAPSINVYATTPTSNTDLIAADYNIARWGAVAFCDTAIAYANWLTGDGGDPETYRNDFIINATGIAAISLINVTKFGARTVHDVSGDTPTRVNNYKGSYLRAYAAEKGNGYKPKLVVAYALPIPVADGDLIGIGIIRRS